MQKFGAQCKQITALALCLMALGGAGRNQLANLFIDLPQRHGFCENPGNAYRNPYILTERAAQYVNTSHRLPSQLSL